MQSSSPSSSSSRRITMRSTRRARHDPPRVLIADDDQDMLEMLVDVLGVEGYDVQPATDGGRLLVALTKSEKCRYEDGVDLLISDIRMPICTGIEIVESLRAAHCFVPVILITGSVDERTRIQAARLGAVLLEKPFAFEALKQAMIELLDAPGEVQ